MQENDAGHFAPEKERKMLNQVNLVGRLTKDVELQKTTSGKSLCNFTIACNNRDKVDFISCVTWNQGAEYLAKYGKKGMVVVASGHLSTKSYEKDGKTVYGMDVTCENVSVFSSGKQNKVLNEE